MAFHPPVLTRKNVLAVAIGVVLLSAFVFFRSGPPATPLFNNIPLPFGVQGNALAGNITFFGQRNGINVYEVTFTNGEVSETLVTDRIYLVHIPNDPAVRDIPVDLAMRLVASTGNDVEYYGYRYSTPSALQERTHYAANRFKDRFPAQFFASGKARQLDPSHGNALALFESVNDITFLRTDNTAQAVRIDPAGALYAFVVNEPGGAILSPKTPGGCGNGVPDPLTEQCDDGNQVDTDNCHNDCTIGIPIPFGSGSSTGTKLSLVMRALQPTNSAAVGTPNLTLVKFDVSAADVPVIVTGLTFRAQSGSLSSLTNYRLWRDTNTDGAVDSIVSASILPGSGKLAFVPTVWTGATIGSGRTVLFEVRADAPAALSGTTMQLAFDTGNTSYVTAQRVGGSLPLTGLRTNGTCTTTGGCLIAVTTQPATVWTIAAQCLVCQAPPAGCLYQGASCLSCGTLVCSRETSTGARLHLSQLPDIAQRTATGGVAGIRLFSFTGSAANDAALLTQLSFRAETGSLTTLSNYRIWKDTNGDNTVDTSVTASGVLVSGRLTFAVPASWTGATIASGATVKFELRADVPLSASAAVIRLGFDTAYAQYVGGSQVTGSVPFAGIKTNALPCPVAQGCQLIVTTRIATQWTVIPAAGNNVCGNGTPETGEECDDGNTSNTDTCTNACTSARCGDTFTQGTEQCDDGNTVDTDACRNNCTLPVVNLCGNGTPDAGEQCDDGNTDDTDGCRNDCTFPPDSGTPLTVSVLTVPAADTVAPGEQDISLLRFRADAGTQELFLKMAMFQAASGALATLEHYELWSDTTGDGVVDGKVLDGSILPNDILRFFSAADAADRRIAASGSTVFEVRADVTNSATVGSTFRLAFKTDLYNYLSATVVATGTDLSSIETDGLCFGACDIVVTTVPSTLWTIQDVVDPCGNGNIDTGEECDEGTANGQAGGDCDATCHLTTPIPDF